MASGASAAHLIFDASHAEERLHLEAEGRDGRQNRRPRELEQVHHVLLEVGLVHRRLGRRRRLLLFLLLGLLLLLRVLVGLLLLVDLGLDLLLDGDVLVGGRRGRGLGLGVGSLVGHGDGLVAGAGLRRTSTALGGRSGSHAAATLKWKAPSGGVTSQTTISCVT